MKGLEICRLYYKEYGEPMLKRDFADIFPLLACGLFGSGSECFGYDDEISRDHDLEPGFCIFLPGEDVVDRHAAFLLERAYAKLPYEYMGLFRQPAVPVGGARRGVIRTAAFFAERTGSPDGILGEFEWLSLPDQALAECVNGELFYDGYGEVSAIRNRLAHQPADVRLKKLASELLLAGQSGQYNYLRCVKHGEPGAAALALNGFANHIMKCCFLICGKYMPFYKWSFRALRGLDLPQGLAAELEKLVCGGFAGVEEAARTAEKISAAIADELRRQNFVKSDTNELERLAYEINGSIAGEAMRNAHILAGA
ncbi:MAG: DUF4037 domain-containing protein [Clostridia bacterium]|nr:DUF4037 domain-containing protein [Clostridia bacterium]